MIKAEMFLKDYTVAQSPYLIQQPLISVIMPTYCRGDNGLLKRAVDSVLEQTFHNFELIIVDDGSVDGTRGLVQEYLGRDDRIVYIRNNINCGLPGLRINQAFDFTRGKYIAYQFDDDYWYPDALESLYHKIIEWPQACLVYGKCRLIYGLSGENLIVGEKFNYPRLMESNCIGNNAVLHSRELFNDYGGYDCHLSVRRACDWDLWVRWAGEVPFIYVDKVVSVSEANQINSMGQICTYNINLIRVRMGVNKNDALRPEMLDQFLIDDISFIKSRKQRKKVFEEIVLPWHEKVLGSVPDFIQYDHGSKEDVLLLVRHCYDASSEITVKNFVKVLKDQLHLVYMPASQLNKEIVKYVDIIILQRTMDLITTQFLLKIQNKPVMYFLDDNLLHLYKMNRPEFEIFRPDGPYYPFITSQLTNVNVVATYSDETTQTVRQYNRRIIQLKTNILERYVLPAEPQNRRDGVTRIAFMGSDARKEEFNFIWDDLCWISEKYGDRVEFYFWGYYPDNKEKLPKSKVIKYPHISSYGDYLQRLKKQNFDIILAPLFDNEVKSAKCPIKYLESVVCNGIGLYSYAKIYEEIHDGVNGFKVRNEEGAWARKIEQVIEIESSKKQDILNNARQDILKRYTTESQVYLFRSALEGSKLHHLLGRRGSICIGFDATEKPAQVAEFLQYAKILKKYGFEVFICLPLRMRKLHSTLKAAYEKMQLPVHYLDYADSKGFMPGNYIIKSKKAITDLINRYNIVFFHSYKIIHKVKEVVEEKGLIYMAGRCKSGIENVTIGDILQRGESGYQEYVAYRLFKSYIKELKKITK